VSQINNRERQEFLGYESFLNEIVAVLAFSLGLQCLGFDDSKYFWIFSKKEFFAFVSVLFIFTILFSRHRKMKKSLIKMKETKHPYLSFRVSLFRNLSYIIAFAFLSLISVGQIK